MNEMEFRFSQFEKFSSFLEGKRVVLYGTGYNAKKIIDKYPQLQIVGLMDRKNMVPFMYGKRLLKPKELITLKIDVIVLASQMQNLSEIYNRICVFCHANKIDVYDMYGNDLYDLFFRLESHQCELCCRNEKHLLNEITRYDIVSIDLFQAIFNMKTGFRERGWWQIATECSNMGFSAQEFVSARQQAEDICTARERNNQLIDIYKEVQGALGLDGKQVQELLDKEKKYIVNNIILDDRMLKVLAWAKQAGKRIVAISEPYFSENEVREILNCRNIFVFDEIICAKDKGCVKSTGLYRELEHSEKKWLHIGEDEVADGLCALIHGLDIFLVKKAEQLPSNSPYYDIFEQIRKWYKEGKIDEIVKYGSDSLYEAIIRFELLSPFYYCSENSLSDNQKVAQLKKLEFTKWDEPLVSIIIPVYNQFLYTYNCLLSILHNTGNISYEIILADDCSTDATKLIDRCVSGITVVRNENNMRFLRNCNHAAEYAKGQYLLFLNNDTYVQPGWLKELVGLAEADMQIGLVGSKLIYPDGKLQEAGGIVWKDASAWNFGQNQVAGAPVYNYVKETDYISGAAIMIRSSLWTQIGGFDERYAPAYYEDTDLAFEVRKHGYKVVYTPFSTVVHFEGVSNGRDVNLGQKAYQTANRDKFYEKWKDVLQTDHFENGTNLFLAKDHSKNRKHILVVDHYVPQYDHDAGGRCTYMYLKAFLKMGMKVTFIGDNFAFTIPYTTELLRMGIEVLYGSQYKLNMNEWLKQNLKYFDAVYLQRPHISIKYIDIVKKYGGGKIFYFAHDLHHIRLKRQYELTGEKEYLLEAKKWEKVEMELFEQADVGHVVGDFEQSYMQSLYPQKPIRNIPLYIFERLYQKKGKSFQERKDILYVGGFGHPPNVDAVMWFAKEIFPAVVEKYPDIKWHVVGNKPPKEIQKLANKNIVIEGFVSDDELEKLYNSCRLVVVPLRVGAGVKGKIVEAAYYQVPVVTTDIGAEGISMAEDALVVENNAEKMAEKICSLYEDYDMLKKYAERERKLIENHYLLKNAMDILQQDMQFLE